MNIVKWCMIVIGMVTLLLGLNVQAYGLVTGASVLDFVSMLYIGGALLLIFPPVIEYLANSEQENRDFVKLLIVLEIFLVFSGILFYWKSDLLLKIVSRIAASLLVTSFLKYQLKQLPNFRWVYLIHPNYYWGCLVGKFGPAYSLSLGIDWLGVGYAFLEFPFGKAALLVGSIYLVISAWRGWVQTKAPISMAWTALNGCYVLFSAFFILYSIMR